MSRLNRTSRLTAFVAALFAAPLAQAQGANEEKLCLAQAPARPEAQIEACSALLASGALQRAQSRDPS